MRLIICLIMLMLIGCQSEEEKALEKKKREVEMLKLEMQKKFLESRSKVSDSQKFETVTLSVESWRRLVTVYFIETNQLSAKFDEIGFKQVERDPYFSVKEVENGIRFYSETDMGECKKGGAWTSVARVEDDDVRFSWSSSSNECAYILQKAKRIFGDE